MASNTTNAHMTSMGKGGGFAPPSAGQHPPGKGKVGGTHSAGATHKIDGGHGKGSDFVHPSLRKGKS